ncbi:MAG: helix-turn-helix transcriptional regulator [Bacilli bacterium]|nr:helix-turn-helix transcriptional regulator [Bacilli bacterium]
MNFRRTDLVEMGRYIAKLRKEKNYTQSQLSELIDVNPKTISKWETGLVAPDVTVLKNLAKALGVSVDEILCGEKIKTIEEKNTIIVDLIKTYMKQAIKKVLLIFGIIIILVIFFCLIIFYIDSHYDWHVLNLQSLNEEFFVKGKVIYNYEKSFFIFDEVSYNSNMVGTIDEVKVLMVNVSLFYNDKLLFSLENSYTDSVPLHKHFKDYRLNYDSDSLKDFDKDKIVLQVFYIDDNEEQYSIFINFK